MPKISVITSAYNAERFIGETIESILKQTVDDWEYIIINDGSTDRTADVVRSYKDSRIKLIDHKKNYGLVPSLNYAISLSSGEYIARTDHDDLSYPDRFENQIKYLEAHPNILLVGGRLDLLVDGKVICQETRPLHTPAELKFALLFGNLSFGHSSFMFRREVFDEFGICYDTFDHVEDHHIQLDVCEKGQLGIVEDKVFMYRVHPEQCTAVRSIEMQQTEEDRCRCIYIDDISLTDKQKYILKKAVCRDLKTMRDYVLYNDAVVKYAIMCGLPNKRRYLKKSEAFAYAYFELLKEQRRTWATLIGYLISPARIYWNEQRFFKQCIKKVDRDYLPPMIDYTKRIEREILPEITDGVALEIMQPN